jgi:hypothetical protein
MSDEEEFGEAVEEADNCVLEKGHDGPCQPRQIVGPDTPDGPGEWMAGNPGKNKWWHLRVSRALTEEESAELGVLMGDNLNWEEDEKNFSLVKTLWCLTKVAPDLEVVAWWHAAYMVYVRGLYLPARVYEILDAMSLGDATEVARNKWKSDYGHHGIRATIAEARLATKRDMRKMVEDKK